ncbi:MAG TPA: 5'-nucleotidase C-terminal domain-containing protein [Gaiellaceae bacterium]
MRLTILHTNDIHGREERIAQISTIVHREKAAAGHPVLYLDAGDVEETTNRLSNLTKGAAMHRLLSLAGCDAAAVGNACWLRYGPASVTEHARVSSYPQLVANFTGIDGTVPSVLLGEVGIFGLTDPFDRFADDLEWGFERRDVVEAGRASARDLRERGAKLVVLLSHLGYEHEFPPTDDRRIAPELQDDVDLIVGAHSHHLLPEGDRVGRIVIAQAGSYGDHIGRIEIDGDRIVASVEAVDADPDPRIADEAARIEAETAEWLRETIGRIDEPLDARGIAELLRVRAGADVGLFSEGQTLGVVPAGVVTRGALFDASETGANPGVTRMTGEQLLDVLRRGNDPAFQAETSGALRGRQRGRLELAGPELDPAREYLVAGSDWELAPYGGYVREEWGLAVEYEFPMIIREAIEEHLLRG